ncbi:CRISPR-associated endonuclease Cas3'' [Marinitenerispora sediminis]|uniref:CRISPR-associated endonuclease Cas3 n=1 Tax=Marinitenerispora sediminis TaxID=1931232 RepID=A0A368T098_9ACTN|nr:CRISPR-associated endonuclease Cas3'' [Marinitenerispora sediminis]RCV52031.1 CRISPR-associated endonuclease Cas3'' [Marinitenerispora sediminis]RCV55754.1 CRISPR-associated endonuclease Cas3'' [Marinitenerispora sediminis]RCV57088.1 CRISPR-associated endonuclease Cas3'' [Marinitenerispora sediminis]
MVGELVAHSPNSDGQWHSLRDHLRGTGDLAYEYAKAFQSGDLGRFLGLAHDVGKGKPVWQDGLVCVAGADRPVGVPHKHEGTWWAARHAGVWSAVVLGHHGGLPDRQDLQDAVRRVTGDRLAEFQATVDRVAREVPEIVPAERPQVPSWVDGRDWPTCDVFMRMLFSAVVDADFLDTERHHSGARPVSSEEPGRLVERFERQRAAMVAGSSSRLAGLRGEVYDYAATAAKLPPGVFRLAAPTGTAKTLAMAGFGLRHLAAHGMRRVVMAVPFLSITDQNAEVLRRLLDAKGQLPTVLEHHSAVELEPAEERQTPQGKPWQRLAAENWDAPFVVTTMVQLFESIFSHRPSAMRKLHRLAGAVILLDEVQAIPDRLVLPILSVLRTLTEHFGTTVVLSSATQPSYWALAPFADLPVRDIVPPAAGLDDRARRVRYEWRLQPRPTWEKVADELADARQSLTIVNTTRDAAALHRLLPDRSLHCRHLSTRMAAEHRARVIAEVKARLRAGGPIALVSTQLIEAGVDLDFPLVWRAWTCADSLQQAAGRCNRDGDLDCGHVVVFDPVDGGHPSDESYKAALAATAEFFGPGLADPDDREAIRAYYRRRFINQNLEHPTGSADKPRSVNGAMIQRWRQDGDFPRVAQAFRMIDEHSVPVVVPRCNPQREKEADDLLRALPHVDPAQQRSLIRRLQPFMASLPQHRARRAVDAGDAQWLGDLLLWDGAYDEHRGLDTFNEEDMVW